MYVTFSGYIYPFLLSIIIGSFSNISLFTISIINLFPDFGALPENQSACKIILLCYGN